MTVCFVIQPFDGGKFDKRFDDIYKPAIEAVGLVAYRVDKDPGVSVPIDAIEGGIKSSSICLADITADNPNVWYELGFAFASGRPIVMVCSEERTGKKYPFDIQHRTIIVYHADSPSDFDLLKQKITVRLQAMLDKSEALRNIAEADPIAPVEGLSHPEVMALAVIAGSISLPNATVSVWGAKREAERAGLTNMGFNLAIRRLTAKRYIEIKELWDESSGEPYDGVRITDLGWRWIEDNESRFLLQRQEPESNSDDIPF